MKTLKTALITTLALTLVVSFIYPFLVFALGELLFTHRANGSLLLNEKREVIGSELIAQPFTTNRYFHPRPSAAGPKGYDASNSAGSDLGPLSKAYTSAVQERAKNYRRVNDIAPSVPIPLDPLTASGSGLDPHITFDNAILQASRVSKARALPINTILQLIESLTEEPFLGLFGAKRVNVLLLNKKLDEIPSKSN